MKHKTPNVVDVTDAPVNRRVILKSVVLSSAGLSVLPAVWTKPVVNSVLLPAHAQASAVIACPMLTTGAGSFSVGSASGTCGLSFELISGDASIPIDVISITNTTPVGTDAVTYSGGTSGSVTATSGLVVNWVGQAIGAPFACAAAAPVPVNEVTFTATYNCASDPAVQTMTFSLQTIAASL